MKTSRTLLALAAGLVFAGCKPAPAPPEEAPVTRLSANTVGVTEAVRAGLVTATAQVRDFPDILSLMGRISAVDNRVVVVPARVAGRIDALYVVSGQFVTKGQALASEYSADYVEAREEYLEALAQDASSPNPPSGGAGAADALDRSDFFDLTAMTRKKLENMGLTTGDIAGLHRGGQTDPHLIIRAPVTGAITSLGTNIGNLQNQGDSLFTIADLSKVWFAGDLYTEDLTKVRVGQQVQITSVDLVKPIAGKLSFISPVMDPVAHTIKVRALIENPDLLLRQDMYVQGNLVLSDRRALLVPTEAVLRIHNQDLCFKRLGPLRYQEVPVTLGREAGGFSEILSGIRNGDVVIRQGGMQLDAVLEAQGD